MVKKAHAYKKVNTQFTEQLYSTVLYKALLLATQHRTPLNRAHLTGTLRRVFQDGRHVRMSILPQHTCRLGHELCSIDGREMGVSRLNFFSLRVGIPHLPLQAERNTILFHSTFTCCTRRMYPHLLYLYTACTQPAKKRPWCARVGRTIPDKYRIRDDRLRAVRTRRSPMIALRPLPTPGGTEHREGRYRLKAHMTGCVD